MGLIELLQAGPDTHINNNNKKNAKSQNTQQPITLSCERKKR